MVTKKVGGAEGAEKPGGASDWSPVAALSRGTEWSLVEQGVKAPLAIFDSSAWFQAGFKPRLKTPPPAPLLPQLPQLSGLT